ncbi:anti-virulence regulator CigR family protein [Azospirillum soli]|uniref:anti-virulence regulator CigR family protein n=1 Tax=Azospirillum soli TaxID=1304799 RepID=UPI001AEB3D07|nr:anti-virulence regulator CigR family protein [Azospirillum soli]MBP2311158.1 hypothetical protein [Azospirillum soli]
MRTYRIVGAALAALLLAGPALAEKPDWAGGGHGGGHGKGHGQGPAVMDDGGPGHGPGRGNGGQGKEKHKGNGPGGGATVVTRTDVDVIRQYFVSYPVGVSSLPPGIAKNLARGKPLPPGIAKKMAPIELRQRVPACMNGWECILAGADMLILDAVHGTIADIIRGVVR